MEKVSLSKLYIQYKFQITDFKRKFYFEPVEAYQDGI